MEERNYIFDKYNLASFLCQEYKDKYGHDITPIKLQKGLYFLFAKWGGKIIAAQGESAEDTEDDEFYGSVSPYLFNADFRAWKYGPVEYDVYKWNKYNERSPYIPDLKPDCDGVFKNEIKKYVQEYSSRVFATSDFGLVDLSHEDDCWKSGLSAPEEKMNNDDILSEYASKV